MTVSKEIEKSSMDSRSFLEQFGTGEYQDQLVWGEKNRGIRMKVVVDLVGMDMLVKMIGANRVIEELGGEKIYPLLTDEQRERLKALTG
jgi:hypothetical protein